MTAISDTPDRTLEQRRAALAVGNEIRSRRAALKRDIKAGRVNLASLLRNPPEWLENAKVVDLLICAPKFGPVKVTKILQVCRVSPSKTVGGLSARQRSELISMMRRARVTRPAVKYGPRAGDQHMQALRMANDCRFARAALKHRVADGEMTAADVLLACPPEAATMTITDLLMSQDRWGSSRTHLFLLSVPIRESKTLGSMTQRQRDDLAARLGGAA